MKKTIYDLFDIAENASKDEIEEAYSKLVYEYRQDPSNDEATNKENGQAESLKVALEATARGIKFLNVDLYESDATVWIAKNDTEIYPPFNSIDGLGDTVAKNIVAERQKGQFISIEDIQKRAKVSQTLIDRMKDMGILSDLPDSNQLSLF